MLPKACDFKTMKKIFLVFLSAILCFALTACSAGTAQINMVNLSEGVKKNDIAYKNYDQNFVDSQMNLALELFKETAKTETHKNALISPVSLTIALAMANLGAFGTTADELNLFLAGSANAEDFNHHLAKYVDALPSGEGYNLSFANSIWINDNETFKAEDSFLQKNADFYGADIIKIPFNNNAVSEINNWVNQKTDGEINSIMDELERNSVMLLLNAVTFDGEWHTPYAEPDIAKGYFTCGDGSSATPDMMHGSENYYLNDGKATGFIKEYKNGKYRFVALMPNEGIRIEDYIATLTAESFANTIKNAEQTEVHSVMPKFKSNYDITLNETLKNLGVKTAFDPDKADFSKLGKSSAGNLYISNVIQKTYISVDEKGTKAGAVSKVEIAAKTSLERPITVQLNRPFVYAIIEAENSIPLFIGTLNKPN